MDVMQRGELDPVKGHSMSFKDQMLSGNIPLVKLECRFDTFSWSAQQCALYYTIVHYRKSAVFCSYRCTLSAMLVGT